MLTKLDSKNRGDWGEGDNRYTKLYLTFDKPILEHLLQKSWRVTTAPKQMYSVLA